MGERQSCSNCGGTGLTEKVEYTYDLDDKGNTVPQRHAYISPCNSCGGTGQIG